MNSRQMKNAFIIVCGVLLFNLLVYLTHRKGSGEKEAKCDHSSEGYKLGFSAGKENGIIWPEPWDYKKKCNNGYGMIGDVPPCFDDGYIDGRNSIK